MKLRNKRTKEIIEINEVSYRIEPCLDKPIKNIGETNDKLTDYLYMNSGGKNNFVKVADVYREYEVIF